MQQLPLDLVQPLRPSFDNFVAGRNAEPLAALQALLAAPERAAARIVYLWGAPGSGRSHLAEALLERGAWRWNSCIDAERSGISVIDDVERLDAGGQVALFNRLNAVRADARCACVATGSGAPAQLPLREDLRTRLAWGLAYPLHPLSDDEKLAALRAHAQARGVQVAEDLLPYLLTHLPRDLRALTAVLDALDNHALARKRALTVPLLKDWLAGGTGPPSP